MHLSDAEVAVAAAQAGAAVARASFGGALVRFEKSTTDFATEADIAAEEAILGVLREARPADAYEGEELGRSGDDSSARTWLIDPICGTVNFAAQTPLMAVNVALRDAGAVTAAVSADPLATEVFWTDGQAAYLRRDGTDMSLSPAPASGLVALDVDSPKSATDRFTAARMLANPAFMTGFRPRVLSTTLALAWVAAGRYAAYLTANVERDSVHFASGIALCQAAGCVVTGLHGQPLHTGAGGLIAAADADTHARLLAFTGRRPGS